MPPLSTAPGNHPSVASSSSNNNAAAAGGTDYNTLPNPVRRRKQQHPAAAVRWRLQRFSLVPALTALAGVSMFLYPDAAAWLTQYNQSQIISNYTADVEQALPPRAEQIRQAHLYNEALSSGAVLDANAHKPRGTGVSFQELRGYSEQLRANDNGLMARIRIPKINLDLPIYHGTDEKTLLAGAGHLEGTSLPVGGTGTRSVITAHRGLAEAEMFTNLDKVTIGDTFSLEVFGEVLTYRVINTEVIEPAKTEAIRAVADEDLATLITCTPLGINSHRILVTGTRVLPTPLADIKQQGATPEVPFFPWWAVYFALSVLAICCYVWWTGKQYANRINRALVAPASTNPQEEQTASLRQPASTHTVKQETSK